MIDLSIIIASYNTVGLTRVCITSVLNNTKNISYEIIVVDDCSTDGSAEMVQKEFPQVRLIRNEHNLRYAKTNNAGLAAATGRYALLLNSDTEVQLHAFDYLVRFMDTHPEAAAAGPKLVNPDGSVQHCIRSFAGMGTMVAHALNLQLILPNNPLTNNYYNTHFDYTKVQQVESIGTTAFILRRATWETFGMLDERFTLAFVDLAYCYMLKQNRQKVFFVPDAVVMHRGSQSINQNSAREIRLLHEALRLFYELYYAPNDGPIRRTLVRAGIRTRYGLKLVENRVSKDKRVIKGPGAPPATPRPAR